ncbi:hypothetical protein PCE1_004490 [Barthelona sp. PCE]
MSIEQIEAEEVFEWDDPTFGFDSTDEYVSDCNTEAPEITIDHLRKRKAVVFTDEGVATIQNSQKVPLPPRFNVNIPIGQTEVVDLLEVDVQFKDKKPWMEAGKSNIDWFNFGYDERTWRTFCAMSQKISHFNKKGISGIGK